MPTPRFKFDEDGARRVVRAVKTVEGLGTDNRAMPNQFRSVFSPGNPFFPVSLETDGGSDGGWDTMDNVFTSPSYTYTATNWITGDDLGTGLSPQWARFPGSCASASWGTGYIKDGTFYLFQVDEVPNVSPCDNYDGEESGS